MRYAIRVNSSSRIGSGHLVRALCLAQRLRSAGGTVTFVARALPGNLDARIGAAGFALEALSGAGADEERFPWVGVPHERDADETADVLRRCGGVDWLVVDNYGLEASWERRLRPWTGGIFAIDDLADRAHDVDALLDQNDVRARPERYRSLVPRTAVLFLGPRYALLRDQFIRERRNLRARDGSIAGVLVAFGTTSSEHALLAARALAAARIERATIVMDTATPAAAAVRDLAAGRDWTVSSYIDDMAAVMARSDLAIGACGTTAWERAYLELPTVAWPVADNQNAVAEGLEAAGALIVLRERSTREADLVRTLRALRADAPAVRALSRAAAEVMRHHDDRVEELYALLERPCAPKVTAPCPAT